MTIFGMGEYAGLEKPNTFSWAYDTADDAYAFEDYGKKDEDSWIAGMFR